MLKVIPSNRFLVSSTLALGLTLLTVNGPFTPVLVSLGIFFCLSWFGSIFISASSRYSTVTDGDSIWQFQVGSFLAGGTLAILSWELSLALGLPGYFGTGLVVLGVVSVFATRKSKTFELQLHRNADSAFNFQEFVSTTALSILLFVAAVPDLRSWLIPLAVLNVLARLVPRLRGFSSLLALIGTIFVIRHAAADPSVLVFTDDSVWAEGFSAIVQQTGFWSWVGVSNVYSPLHWLAYGIAGWFTKATDNNFLFGVTMAFPAVMSVVGATIVSQLRIKKSDRLTFLVQVLAIIVGLQLIGSQSISADLGFVAVLTFALLARRSPSTGVLAYVALICIAIAKIQFVPVIAIVIVVSNLLDIQVNGLMFAIRKTVLQLGTVLLTSLLVLDKIPLSKIFGWETNAGWGSSKVRFRGAELTDGAALREALSGTFFVFVPAIIILLVYLLAASTPRIREIAVPLCVTAASLVANVLFEIENREYFGWISGALCAMYLFASLLGNTDVPLSRWLKTSTAGAVSTIALFIFLVSRPQIDKWQGLQRTQVVIAFALAASVVLISVPRISRLRNVASLRSMLGFSGVALLCLPSLISTTDSFRESGFSIVAKSGYSLSDLGYTDDLLRAGKWVRQHTDPDEVIATNVLCEIGTACFLDGRPIISAATHRRTFIEAERFAYGYSPIQSGGTYPSWIVDRLQASMNCAASGDDASCSVLRSAGVELVLIDTTRVSGSNGLEVCATFGSIQVVSVQSSNPDSNGSCHEGE